MLDMTTIQQLEDLMAQTLYHAEIAHLPQLSRAEVQGLIDRARQGDNEAKDAFLISCLHHTLGVARFLYYTRLPQHDDLLDLAQEASERMLEKLDRALATSAPAAYLRGVGRRAIMDYCTYHSGIINKPEYTLALLEKMDAHATVVTLDAQMIDCIQCEELAEPKQEESDEHRYEELYQAIQLLSPPQQETIIRLYGLFGQPEEKAADIGHPNLIRNRAYEARNKLGVMLGHTRQKRSRSMR